MVVDIATIAQLSSGVSLTGSIDDSWAAISGGWKLIDINAESASSGIIMEASGPVSEDWRVFIVLRGEREQRPELDSFSFHRQAFSRTALHIAGNLRATSASTWWEEEERDA